MAYIEKDDGTRVHIPLNPGLFISDIRSRGKNGWRMSQKKAADRLIAFAYNWVEHNPIQGERRRFRPGDRAWINQPSTLQPYHNLNGELVIIVAYELNGSYTIAFTHGDVESQIIAGEALSAGWPTHLQTEAAEARARKIEARHKKLVEALNYVATQAYSFDFREIARAAIDADKEVP